MGTVLVSMGCIPSKSFLLSSAYEVQGICAAHFYEFVAQQNTALFFSRAHVNILSQVSLILFADDM